MVFIIIFIVIIFASSFYVKEQPSFNLNYLSQDITKTLSTLTIKETDKSFIDKRNCLYSKKITTQNNKTKPLFTGKIFT